MYMHVELLMCKEGGASDGLHLIYCKVQDTEHHIESSCILKNNHIEHIPEYKDQIPVLWLRMPRSRAMGSQLSNNVALFPDLVCEAIQLQGVQSTVQPTCSAKSCSYSPLRCQLE